MTHQPLHGPLCFVLRALVICFLGVLDLCLRLIPYQQELLSKEFIMIFKKTLMWVAGPFIVFCDTSREKPSVSSAQCLVLHEVCVMKMLPFLKIFFKAICVLLS